MSEKRELLVKRFNDGFIARRVDVTGWPEEQITRQIGGMLINANTDDWCVCDTAWDKDAEAPKP